MVAGRIWTKFAGKHDERDDTGTSLASAMTAFSVLSLAPDLDVIAFRLGIPYAAPLGHRGAAHSLCIAVALASIAVLATRRRGEPGMLTRLWALCAVVAVSHALLDTLTDGGLGVALFWPISNRRYFAPWRPIPVAPIGARMLTARGLDVVMMEALQFSPLLVWALWPRRSSSR
jgi:inner membrane protein